jgi:hypothetical protein
MPIMVVYRGPGVTPADYAPYEADIRSAPVPPEALIHQVAFDDEGLLVVDVWTSRDAFDAWTKSRIKPTLAKYGVDYAEPQILDAEVVATGGAFDQLERLKTHAGVPA